MCHAINFAKIYFPLEGFSQHDRFHVAYIYMICRYICISNASSEMNVFVYTYAIVIPIDLDSRMCIRKTDIFRLNF